MLIFPKKLLSASHFNSRLNWELNRINIPTKFSHRSSLRIADIESDNCQVIYKPILNTPDLKIPEEDVYSLSLPFRSNIEYLQLHPLGPSLFASGTARSNFLPVSG